MLKTWCFNSINLLKSSATLQQQVRTTFVLKRKYDPLLHKTNAKPKKLRAKHFIYELVEDTNVKRRPNLELVLKTYVEGVGEKGDVVSVRPNFAYNKLLLPGLAVYKTEENIKLYSKTEEDKQTITHSSAFAQRTINNIERFSLAVVMNKDHPWVVEKWHIKASLRKAGIHCPEECITMPDAVIEGPDMNKEGKVFYCTITVNNMEKARLSCRIHHWSTDPSERLPYVPEYWKLPTEPLFGSENSKADNVAKVEEK
ncbi:39S ribosomal protein L9, mitochondrial [Anastrepha obliqua]|uniref:39S ribosomal protein L9, mitochondrial n=1 Tax=Anastrepha ludens TaxID=28586 RepID=UPI0023AFECDF|nr:39S ribosomal protein L9, mitochondrial [Anastrepha ludens]XP_054731993.1 39S ribosomal protein L9, mitochondrial [Anastrepha obliqua]